MTATNSDNISAGQRPLRVLVSGGGTGGHIFPALSIASALKRRQPEAEILFVGAEGRMEMERVPAAGFPIKGLPVAGFDRRRPWRNFKVLWKLFKSMRRARRILRDFNPDIAVGVGGYASGPMLKQAQKHGVPTLLQEQNSYAGVTNRLLGKKARAICVAYDGMDRFFPADRIVMTGNPVRRNLADRMPSAAEAREALGFDPARPLLVVVGGSLGARTINNSMAAAIDSILAAGVDVLWQTGKLYYDEFAPMAEGRKGLKIVPFITDMNTAYAAATLVVSRAGAGTISELQILGKAALLVPSPNVAENHQFKNAMALVDRDAAVMVTDADAPARLGAEVLGLIADESRLQRLSDNIRAMALPDADELIVDRILEITSARK